MPINPELNQEKRKSPLKKYALPITIAAAFAVYSGYEKIKSFITPEAKALNVDVEEILGEMDKAIDVDSKEIIDIGVEEVMRDVRKLEMDDLIDLWTKVREKRYFGNTVFAEIVNRVRQNPTIANDVLKELTKKGLDAQTFGNAVLTLLAEKAKSQAQK